jgi:hypothetical protein
MLDRAEGYECGAGLGLVQQYGVAWSVVVALKYPPFRYDQMQARDVDALNGLNLTR